jgi:hypothetical protein
MKWAVIVLGLLVLIALGLSPVAYRLVREYQAAQHVKAAQAAHNEGDSIKAYMRLRSASNLHPDGEEIRRLLGPYGTAVNHPRALDWWIEAAKAGLLDPNALVELVEYGYNQGYGERVDPFLSQLLRDRPDLNRVKELELQSLQVKRQDYEAFVLAREMIREDIATPEVLSTYIVLTFSIPQSTMSDRLQAMEILQQFSDRNNELGILALRNLLVFWYRLNADGKALVAERLNRHPEATFDDHLELLTLKLEDGADKEAILKEAQSRYDALAMRTLIAGVSEDLSGFAPQRTFSRWLNHHGFYETTLKVLEKLPVEEDADLFFAHQLALIQSGQPKAAYERNLSSNPLAESRELILRALALERMGEGLRVKEILKLVVQVVNVHEVEWLETILEASGRTDLLIEMFEGLESRMSDPLPARLKLLHYYYEALERAKLSRIVQDIDPIDLSRIPKEQVMVMYLRLILQHELAETRRGIERMVMEFPNIVDFRVLLAFAYALEGDQDSVRGLMENLDESFLSRNQPMQVCMAYASFVSGDFYRADRFMEELSVDLLFHEERLLYRDMQEGLAESRISK